MFVLDSHCDTPSRMMRGADIGIDNEGGHVDLPKLKAGRVDASFFALYTSANLTPDEATRRALEMLAGVYDAIDANPDKVAMALSPQQALDNKARGLISILVGMENGAPIQKSLPLLRLFYRMGVRYMTLTHNGDNEIADSAAGAGRWHGLSPFGREVVGEMNRLGMIIDVAHVSDETFYDVIRYSESPVVSTHSCCRALAGHRRNMTDDMLRTLAAHGGVMQVNFYPVFLSDEYADGFDEDNPDDRPRPSYKRIVDHIDHAVDVAGIDHVGIGSDFDGIEVTPEGMENISMLPKIFDEMTLRGYSNRDIEKVAGKNFLRVFNEVISNSLH